MDNLRMGPALVEKETPTTEVWEVTVKMEVEHTVDIQVLAPAGTLLIDARKMAIDAFMQQIKPHLSSIGGVPVRVIMPAYTDGSRKISG